MQIVFGDNLHEISKPIFRKKNKKKKKKNTSKYLSAEVLTQNTTWLKIASVIS